MDIKKGKNSQIFGEITIKASPPIYIIGGGRGFDLQKVGLEQLKTMKNIFLSPVQQGYRQ